MTTSIRESLTRALRELQEVPDGVNVIEWLKDLIRRQVDVLECSDNDNIILLSDSYKVSHWVQYPPGTEYVYSYFESRGGVYPDVLFFGLQYIVKRYLVGCVVTMDKIDQAEEFFALHFGSRALFNRKGWEHIAVHHGGRLPLSIKAVPEGTLVACHNVLLTVVNTDPACFWLTNFVESLLVQVWYPCTVATMSRAQKLVIRDWLKVTGTLSDSSSSSELLFKLHDFGFRGVSSVEAAGIGGAAHLINFRGTDTMVACVVANKYYGEPMAGYSVPASEHSTMTSWGRENESDAYKNMLAQYPSESTVACVSDSWDIFNATEKIWGCELKELVLNREGRLVIRPDSGEPVEVVLKVLDILGKCFEEQLTLTSTGRHRLLPSQVRLIQGDSVDIEMISKIYAAMDSHGWAAENVGFGSGGALLQKMNRDTQKFAFKCSAVVVNGVEREVYKDPVTDPGKKSKRGRLALVCDEKSHVTKKFSELAENEIDLLEEVFRDGAILKQTTLKEIRQKVDSL